MNDVTRVLDAIDQGDAEASQQLMPLVYDELKRLARAKMSAEAAEHTLSPTALVHEAYLRLVDGAKAQGWNSRGHFFGAAAEAMRRILVENARRKQQLKRGSGLQRVDLDQAAPITYATPEQLIELDDLLSQLDRDDPSAAQVFKLRYFTGLSLEQAAELLGVSRATAYRQWTFVRAWLQSQLPAEH